MARGAPEAVKDLQKELSLLSSSIRILAEDVDNTDSTIRKAGESRIKMTVEMMEQARQTLEKLEVFVKKYDLSKAAGKSRIRRG